ncbi:hypothetical protein BDZ45DRAFT_437272 [Acephala macrosclerotiorum]|nr:hypothetical protein BDZ45DRAFT_437272 [Acephala macrosclerotiorum]
MTGLEVIGALASIAQVSQYAVSIVASLIRLYGTLEAAPGKLRLGCKQLDQLSETVTLIQCNSALQTQNVLAQADALAEQIVLLDKMLKEMLAQTKKSLFKKVARAYLGNQSEAKVAEAFAQIEMKKSALGLSVLEVNMYMTSTILNKVDALQATGSPGSTPSTPTLPDVSASALRDREPDEGSCRLQQSHHHVYKNVISIEEALQVNGNIGPPNYFGSKNRYMHVVASGKSIQLNGHISAAKLNSFFSIKNDNKY